jgi:hypothetical protein
VTGGRQVGFYREQALPRIISCLCGQRFEGLRGRVCAGLAGDVVEIGFGSGLNVPFYPAAVTRVAAIEPADVGWKLAARRVAAARLPMSGCGAGSGAWTRWSSGWPGAASSPGPLPGCRRLALTRRVAGPPGCPLCEGRGLPSGLAAR